MTKGKTARTSRLPIAAVLPLALLAACSGGDDDDPRAVTADEAAQLNDAAAMLDANSVDLDALDTDGTTSNDTDAQP
ncbi:hypothetical protein M9979_12435 [Sphingomonas sp. RP10(2022)]|uniref:Uncharacterized protein n=1 Tax=Sphingomonas liriopis TaxID=2949094 RepID=A0A9X2HWU7_9SPHN|nr:hypothetical protein [Sphingomonas liriopis]MCP3735681.1 hypothetical protein [Sphingomonas liriopis]